VNTDKKVRDKALKVLEKRLAQQQKFSETDLLKVWKALFYCTLIRDNDTFCSILQTAEVRKNE
jgi:hypothetical protein